MKGTRYSTMWILALFDLPVKEKEKPKPVKCDFRR